MKLRFLPAHAIRTKVTSSYIGSECSKMGLWFQYAYNQDYPFGKEFWTLDNIDKN